MVILDKNRDSLCRNRLSPQLFKSLRLIFARSKYVEHLQKRLYPRKLVPA